MILGCLVAAVLLASGASSPEPERDVRVVIVSGETAFPSDLTSLVSESGWDEAWVWSRGEPAVRILPGQALDEALEDVKRRDVAVEVDGLSEREKDSGTVLGAPIEMWEKVPENLLPTFPLQKGKVIIPAIADAELRLRFAGERKGSWWTTAGSRQGSVRLAAFAAPPHNVVISGPSPARPTLLRIGSADVAGGKPLARFSSDRGRIEIGPLPDQDRINLIFRSDDFAPLAIQMLPSDIPAEVTLEPGRSLSGRFVDARKVALAGVEIIVDGWLSDDVSERVSARATSSVDGRWRVGELPLRPLALVARKKGRVTLQQRIDLPEMENDLGDLILLPGMEMEVVVSKGDGLPVEGARVAVRNGPPSFTDAEGRAILSDLDPEAEARFGVSHENYLTHIEDRVPPWPETLAVTLQAPLLVKGRFVDDLGEPVHAPSLILRVGNRESGGEVGADGSFEVRLKPRVAAELVLSGSNVSALTVAIPAGGEGDVRDLGVIAGQRGGVVRGRLARRSDGTAVAGARIWTPRPAEGGAILSFARGDLIQDSSDSNGEFEMRGLPFGRGTIRIDAPGLARETIEIETVADGPPGELGTVWMSEGATVVVSSQVEQGIAVLDFLGEGNEFDMLQAPIIDGQASLRAVPAGESRLSVTHDGAPVCERSLTVPAGPATLETRCDPNRVRVRGEVVIAGRPARGGMVTWMRPAAGDAVIFSRFATGGVAQQKTMGGGPREVTVGVSEQGLFETDRLLPGSWTVRWMGDGGSGFPPRQVQIPETETWFVRLEIEGGSVEGVVVDGEGRPITAVRVRDLDGDAVTLSGADGRFYLGGLPVGVRRIQARTVAQASPIEAVEIRAENPLPPIRLTLDDAQREEVGIRVSTGTGTPAVGAFVILEASSGESRLLTTDSTGTATALFPAGLSGSIRLAASHMGEWYLGPWIAVKEIRGALSARIQRTGSLLIHGLESGERIEILTADGWSLSTLHRRLGVLLQGGGEKTFPLSGLPAGTYTLIPAGGVARTFRIEPGRTVSLDLDR